MEYLENHIEVMHQFSARWGVEYPGLIFGYENIEMNATDSEILFEVWNMQNNIKTLFKFRIMGGKKSMILSGSNTDLIHSYTIPKTKKLIDIFPLYIDRINYFINDINNAGFKMIADDEFLMYISSVILNF